MHTTYLRREHVHGALLGVAIGEALGYARSGLSKRSALRLYGNSAARFQFLPGVGVYGENTRLTLLNAQALLNCRNEMQTLRGAFRWRLRWYLLSVPRGLKVSTLKAGARSWLVRALILRSSSVHSPENQAAARAAASASILHGSGHRVDRWIEESTQLTHSHPLAVDGCRALGMLSLYGCTHTDTFDCQEALQAAIEHSEQSELKDKLSQLPAFLAAGRGPRAVARHFGWDNRIQGHIVPTTVMATYCAVRYSEDYLRAVRSAITLGGDAAALGAIVGGIVGAHLGASRIPAELVERLGGRPHDADWLWHLAQRFSHWPHGADDLYDAPAQRSFPLRQLARNLCEYPVGWVHRLWRLRLCLPC